MRIYYVLTVLILHICGVSFAQIGIGTTSPDVSTLLDIEWLPLLTKNPNISTDNQLFVVDL